jgi:hypothetical protein
LVTGTVLNGWDDRPTGMHNKAGKPIRELVANEAMRAFILDMPRQKAAGISLTRIG